MTTYIALLRGINVSGQKKIQMAGLRSLFESLGYKDVQSYIQSGNIIFRAESQVDPSDIQKKIEEAIQKQYEFFVPVLIKTSEIIEEILKANPYKKEAELEPNRVLVSLLQETPDLQNIQALNSLEYPPDRFKYSDKAIYLHCPNGAGKSKLSNNLFETKLKVKATTRNIQTLTKILALVPKTNLYHKKC